MSCPTCGHTLASITSHMQGPADSISIWHCERCGTLAVSHGGIKLEVYRPKLVDRCRDYAAENKSFLGLGWVALGIFESIRPPGERT